MPLQVRMLTSKSLEAERERSESKDAKHVDNPRNQGLLDGTKVGGTRKPRISSAASYCVSYKLDENGNKVGAHVFTPSNRKPNRRKLSQADKVEIADKLATRVKPMMVTDINVTNNIGRDYS